MNKRIVFTFGAELIKNHQPVDSCVYINAIYTQFTGHIHFSTKYIPVLAANKKNEKKDILVVKNK